MSAAVKVHVASVLFEYTGDAPEIEARGATLRALFADLDKRHPGLRFRVIDEQDQIREHMNVFIAGRATRSLDAKVGAGDEVHILQALSGG